MSDRKRKVIRWITRLCIFCMLILCSDVYTQAAAGPSSAGPTAAVNSKLSKTSVQMVKGFDKTLKIKKVSGKKVTWKTSNSKIVSIKKKSNTQVVLQAGQKTGTAVVTAKVGKKSYKCKVTVGDWYYYTTNGLTFEKGNSTVISSKEAKLTKFSSTNKSVATVTKNGQVVGKKKGSCYIYFYAGRYKYKLKVNVLAKPVAPDLLIGSWKYQKGGSYQYTSTKLKAGKTGSLELKNSITGIIQDFVFHADNAFLQNDLSITSSNPNVLSFAWRDGQYYKFYSLQDGSTVLTIRYKNYSYNVKVTISDTNSGIYQQWRNSVYRALNISTSTPKQYASFLLAAWMCDNIVYDYDYVKSSKGINASYKDYFISRELVCAGYADLYMYLCNGIGIPCRQVDNKAMDHRWNQIWIDGGWYNVDVCWMDAKVNGEYSMQYFLVSDSCMDKYSDHQAGDIYKVSNIRFDGCCEEQRTLQNAQLRWNYDTIYSGYSEFSPWLTGSWRNY